jgi:hypothetical protein
MANLSKMSFLCLIMVFLSCTRPDGNIIGTWQAEQESEGSVNMWSIIKMKIGENGQYDKTVTLYIGGKTQEVKESGTWKKDGNIIVFTETTTETGDPLITAYDIKELSDNTLILSSSDKTGTYKWRYERKK